jgi:hypothetical protein
MKIYRKGEELDLTKALMRYREERGVWPNTVEAQDPADTKPKWGEKVAHVGALLEILIRGGKVRFKQETIRIEGDVPAPLTSVAMGETFWFVGSIGDVKSLTRKNDSNFYEELLRAGNCFCTEAEAIAYRSVIWPNCQFTFNLPIHVLPGLEIGKAYSIEGENGAWTFGGIRDNDALFMQGGNPLTLAVAASSWPEIREAKA